jgi:molybdopterin converting factor small subunit
MSADGMEVRVLFFSVLRDVTGAAELAWTLPPGATVGDLLVEVFERWPRLRDWDASLLLAVDLEYSDRATPLRPGCEVAVMPPVQGG